MTTTTSPTERVGRYQLLEPIGVGPSGAVSRAKVFGVAGFERQFAVKRFHAELTATAAMAAMLSAAARAYGSLEHPRIARMSEFGVAQGSTFTAVEYVPGLDALRLTGEARLAGLSLAAGGALALVSQAARAVGYAHGRGLTHLGLAPTNVIVTADGDIKITDFGILSATLPPRPIEVPRLAQRIPYLAPEQLANEATSAATDVFALGVLAYELVTGTRTFKGDTPQQVASAIMAGPPGEPPLPRPIVRVLQRCLARSPFERFPDARALADALDAALRVAPVPGTRKDIGAQVKETLDRLAALNEGQMSGVVALHLGTGPVRRLDEDVGLRDPDVPEPAAAPYEIGPPDPYSPSAGGPTTLTGGAATLSDLPRQPLTTVPGLAPPPIPVPPGVGSPASSAPSGPPSAGTLPGMGRMTPPAIPTVKPRAASVSGAPPVPPAARRAQTVPDLAIPIEPVGPRVLADATTESAVHPLDTSDLESLDPASSEDGDTVLGDASDAGDAAPPSGGGLGDPAARAAATRAVGGAPTPSSTRAADDFLDAPTHAVSDDEDPGRPDAPATSYRLDASSIDTRPLRPVTLESSLFDPIDRSSDRPTDGANERAVEPSAARADHGSGTAARQPASIDEDDWFDPAGRAPTVPTRDEPAPGSGRVAASSLASPEPLAPEPKMGQTILGFAGPPLAPRSATPLPFPSVPPAPPAEPPADPLSAMMLEGFHAAPASAPSEAPPAWRDVGVIPASDPSELPRSPPAMAPAMVPEGSPYPRPPGWIATPPSNAPIEVRPPQQRRPIWILVGMLGAAIVGIAAWQLYVRLIVPPAGRPDAIVAAPSDARLAPTVADAAQVATATADATEVVAVAPDVAPDAARIAAAPADAARVATAPADAARVAAAKPDAGAPSTAVPTAVSPSAPGDNLAIASMPPGARVFLDGADAGATPLKLPGSPDRHTIALLLAGHELYVAQVDGHGTFQIPLKEVTPSNGPAGIKVLRCKDKERYYVFIDGKPTGQTCPTERIGCELGAHTVEVYDVVSETRRKWDIVVKETRLSFRVRVE